jgi:hypothetical protein
MIRIYARLVAWLPQGFRDAFADEMSYVYTCRVREARRRGGRALLRTFLGELLALPGLWFLACRRERRDLIVGHAEAGGKPDGRASWGATLAAALPLAAFIALTSLSGAMRGVFAAVRLTTLYRLLWTHPMRIAAVPAVFYLLLLGGLLVAWRRSFPRWSYPYLGWLLVFALAGLGISGLDDPYLWRTWVPLLVTLLLALVLRRSTDPLRALWHSWRRDWTLSTLAVLGILQFLVWASYDEMPGPRRLWRSLSMAVLVLGALGYVRASRRAGRIVALLGSVALSVALTVVVTAYHWHGVQLPHMTTPMNGGAELLRGLMAWTVLSIVLMIPAALSVALNHLLPDGSTGH